MKSSPMKNEPCGPRSNQTQGVSPGREKEGEGGFKAAFFTGTEVREVKQFLVMKMVHDLNQMAGMVALPGLFTLDGAEQFVKQATSNEPGSMYVIQEVGAA
jgi:hypothetical protein